MNALQGIDLFNIAMGLGIIVLILAIRDIERSNRELRDRNLYERERDKELFPEFNRLSDGRGSQENGH